MQPSEWLERYRAGACAEVWAALTALGSTVREGAAAAHAESVAAETMSRVRTNVETLVERLRAAGYVFERREEPHVPPTQALVEEMRALEARVGPLPLSLRSFYEVVGTVDYRQVVRSARTVAFARAIIGLRARDPRGVQPPGGRAARSERRPAGLVLFRAGRVPQGELQRRRELPRRAPRSCGGLSNSRVVRRPRTGEMFVSYLRETFAGGGFRGRVGGDEERSWTVPPDLELTRTLAAGLLPV